MDFRFPDDPLRISRDALKGLDDEAPGTWCMQPKYDGWRRPIWIHEDGRVAFHAKRNSGEEAAKQPPTDLVEEFRSLGWPTGIALDAEWMGPRLIDVLKGEHRLYLFDIVALNGEFLQGMAPKQRYENLRTLFEMVKAKSKTEASRIVLAPMWEQDLWKHFEELEKHEPLCEGVVLRHKNSGLIGNRWEATKNKLWHKVKWRDIKERTAF
jgi:ATP-dependent DNA ligase